MKLWKALGLAGLAGVATTGAIIARNQRARTHLTPDQVRERLHQRLEESGGAGEAASRSWPAAQLDGGQPSTDKSARA